MQNRERETGSSENARHPAPFTVDARHLNWTHPNPLMLTSRVQVFSVSNESKLSSITKHRLPKRNVCAYAK